MKKTIALLLALGMLLCLSACGGRAEPDPNAGLYEAVSATALGYTIPVEDVFEEGFSLELKNGGKASFHYEGKDYGMKWTLKGEVFHAEGGGAKLDGSLANGVMVLQNVLDSGIDITLVCEALTRAAAAEASQPVEAETSAAAEEPADRAAPEESAEPAAEPEPENSAGETEAPAAEPEQTAETDPSPLFGQWRHESGYTYLFEADGSGSYSRNGEYMYFTYQREDDTLSILYEGSTLPMKLGFSVEGDTLTIIDSFGKEVPYLRYEEEPVLRALESLPVFDAEAAMDMSNWMNYGRFVIEDDVFYGDFFLDSSNSLQAVTFAIVHEGTDLKAGPWELLDEGCAAYFLHKRGDLLYFVEQGPDDDQDSCDIVCMGTDGSGRKVLVEGPCYYLRLVGDRMFFTDEAYRLWSADLSGNDRQLLLDKEVYYAYPLNEDWVLYQDDADNESLHLYYLPRQFDLKLNDEPSYEPKLVGSRLFYFIADGEVHHLCCIDLSSWETVRDPRLNCQVPVFTPERSELPMGGYYSFDGTYLLPANNYNGKEPQYWMYLEDDAFETLERCYVYHSPDYEIEFKYNNDYIKAIMFRDRSTIYSNAIPWLH